MGIVSGRVDIRVNKKTGKARLRFYGAAPEHVETILTALSHARSELTTHSDTVALEGICLGYLNGLSPQK
jgi:hypothetical protein